MEKIVILTMYRVYVYALINITTDIVKLMIKLLNRRLTSNDLELYITEANMSHLNVSSILEGPKIIIFNIF